MTQDEINKAQQELEQKQIEEFDKQQLEILLEDLKDINKFTSFKNGTFIYDLGKYKANTLLNYIQQLKETIEKAKEYIENTDDFDIEIFDESTGGCLGTDLSKGAKNLLNILNGDDK